MRVRLVLYLVLNTLERTVGAAAVILSWYAAALLYGMGGKLASGIELMLAITATYHYFSEG